MNGGDWSLLGVALSVVGTLVAAYGTRVSSNAAASRSEQLATKSDEIAKLSQENAKLNQELAAFATGGDSFIYIHLENFGKPDREAKIRNVGGYPVRDTQINVFDVTDQLTGIASRRVGSFDLRQEGRKDAFVDIAYPHLTDRILANYIFETNPERPAYAYFLYITTSTGRFRELVHLVNTDGSWRQAYFVERFLEGNKMERVVQHFDDGYPTSGEAFLVRREGYNGSEPSVVTPPSAR